MTDIGFSIQYGRTPGYFVTVSFLGAFFFSPLVFGRQPEKNSPSQETAANAPAEIEQGLWPSPNLMRLMLTRWAEDAAYEYDLDDQQREKTRKAVVQRWTRFLDEHRKDIQPLANEFLEMWMGITPPQKEHVQDWAKRAKPFFDKAANNITEGTSEYREILRPDQRIKFEIDALQMKVGLGVAQQKFDQWEKGEFEPNDFWEPIGPDRDARRDERRKRRREREAQEAQREQKRKAADEQLVDPIDAEMDVWQQYVADFISSYGLDSGQRSTVLSCLTELRDRAIAHRNRHREEIIRLEERIASNTGTDSELAEIKDQLTRLYGPIDEMFKELQSRIEQVPTGDQRVSAKAIPDAAKRGDGSNPAEIDSSRVADPAALFPPKTPPSPDATRTAP